MALPISSAIEFVLSPLSGLWILNDRTLSEKMGHPYTKSKKAAIKWAIKKGLEVKSTGGAEVFRAHYPKKSVQ